MQQVDYNCCQVCFISTCNPSQCNQLIKCLHCGKTAHRYCYYPSQTGISFICDLCHSQKQKTKNSNILCCMCSNTGLLKYAGKKFAHVICLLTSPFAFVEQYEKLTFKCFEDGRKNPKKTKCEICLNSTSNTTKCFSKGCKKSAHLYCCMKLYGEGEQNQWKPTLNMSYKKKQFENFYENQAKRYIKSNYPFLQKKLKINITRPITPQIYIGCPIHFVGLIQCCEKIDDTDWILCEQCAKWYHISCIDEVEVIQTYANIPFICAPCKQWRITILNNQDFVRKIYPKMHIYDYVYIQLCLQRRRYAITQKEEDLIFTIPIYPSLVYMNYVYKHCQIQPKLKNLIDCKKIKKKLTIKNITIQEITEYFSETDIIQIIEFLIHGNFTQSYHQQRKQRHNQQLYVLNLFQQYHQKISQQKDVGQIIQLLRSFTKSTKNKNILKKEKNLNKQINELKEINMSLSSQNITKFNSLKKIIDIISTNQNLKSIIKEISQQKGLKQLQCLCKFDLPQDSYQYMVLRNKFKQYETFFDNQWVNRNQKINKQEKQLFNSIQTLYAQSSLIVQIETKDYIRMLQCTKNITIPKFIHNQPPEYILISQNVNNSSIFKQIQKNCLKKISQIIPVCYDRDNQYRKSITAQLKIKKILQKVKNIQICASSINYLRKIQQSNRLQQNKVINQITSSFINVYDTIQKLLAKQKSINQKGKLDRLKIFNTIKVNDKNLHLFLDFFSNIKKNNTKLAYLPKNVVQSITLKAKCLLEMYNLQKNVFRTYEQYQLINNIAYQFLLESPKLKEVRRLLQQQNARISHLTFNFDDDQNISSWIKILPKEQIFIKSNNLQFINEKLRIIKLWLHIYRLCQECLPIHLLKNKKSIQTKQKIMYQNVKEINVFMIKTNFPDCQLKKKIKELEERGSDYKKHIDEYFETASRMNDVGVCQLIDKIKSLDFISKIQKIEKDCFNFQVQIMTINNQIAEFNKISQKADQILISQCYEQACSMMNRLNCQVFQYEKIKQLKQLIKQKSQIKVLKHKTQKISKIRGSGKSKDKKNTSKNESEIMEQEIQDEEQLKEAFFCLQKIEQNRHKVILKEAVKVRKLITSLNQQISNKFDLYDRITNHIDMFQQVVMLSKKLIQKYNEEIIYNNQDILSLKQIQYKYNAQYIKDPVLENILTQFSFYERINVCGSDSKDMLIRKIKIINMFLSNSFMTPKLKQTKDMIMNQLHKFDGITKIKPNNQRNLDQITSFDDE